MTARSHIVWLGDERFVLRVGEGGEVRVDGLGVAFHVTAVPGGLYLVDGQSGKRWRVFVSGSGGHRQVFVEGEAYDLQVEAVEGSAPSSPSALSQPARVEPRADVSASGAQSPVVRPAAGPARRRASAHVESLTVPMPARVVKVLVTVGQAVRRGDIVMKLEAMKMELPLRAPRDGTIRAIACREGELVQPGVSVLEMT
jgi:biotin carboxyl carrier protein